MYKIKKIFPFCYGHRLLNDTGRCGKIHGHSGKIEVVLQGNELDNLGMLKNFDSIKETVGKWIGENWDHGMLLHKSDPLVAPLKEAGEKLFLCDWNPTAENMAREIFNVAKRNDLPVRKVVFWESDTASATYKYKE